MPGMQKVLGSILTTARKKTIIIKAVKMAQWVKALVTKAGHLGSILRTHMVEVGNSACKLSLPSEVAVGHVSTHTDTHTVP